MIFAARPVAIIAFCSVLAIAGTLLGLHFSALNAAPGETGAIAINILTKGYMGNPYLVETGPTAHASPLLSYGIASIYFLFGENSLTSRAALSFIASIEYGLCVYLCLSVVETVCNRRDSAVLVAAGLLIATSFYLFSSALYFRQWDQPTSALILIGAWRVQARANQTARGPATTLILAALTGVGTLVSPALLPPLAGSLLLVLARRGGRARIGLHLGLAALVVAVILAPWGIRNEQAFGRFILTRSNFGLELASGNEDGSTGISGTGEGWLHHPHDNLAAATRMAEIGEMRYMDEMTATGLTWIAHNKGRFVALTLLRIGECFTLAPGWVPLLGQTVPVVLVAVFCGAKLSAMAFAFLFRRRRAELVCYCIAPLAPFFITHVNGRYPFVVLFTFIAFIAIQWAELADRSRWARREASRASSG
jgi:hypothetical protein